MDFLIYKFVYIISMNWIIFDKEILMRVLHSHLIFRVDDIVGIANQMHSESKAANKLNINYKVKLFTTTKTSSSICDKYSDLLYLTSIKSKSGLLSLLEFRQSYYRWLKTMEQEVDCFVLRHIPGDPLQYYFIKTCAKPVCLIHHTKEIDEITNNRSFKNYIKAALEYTFGILSIRSSYITTGVTKEIVNYELLRASINSKPTIVKPNGIEIKYDNLKDRRMGEVPVLLFVASHFFDWHGLDLLIEAVNQTSTKIKIHLVGEIGKKDLVKVLNNDSFIIHGKLKEDEIAKISEECWASIGSLAMFRNNLKEGSTLKVRSYLSMGLPVYSGYVESFPKDFIFYQYTNENIDIDSLITFCYKNRIYSKEDIRSHSAKYISIETIVNNFYSDLQEILN